MAVMLRRLVPLLVLASAAAGLRAAELQGVRVHQAPDYTRVVLDTSVAPRYELFQLADPQRVVIDLAGTTAAPGLVLSGLAASSDAIDRMRSAPRGGAYRLVLETGRALDPKAFALKPVAPYGHRLVIDLFDKGYDPSARRALPKLESEGLRDVIIAIDAGHGGEDPGALGPNRIKEKTVVMGIARRVKRRLDQVDGYRALLVRTGDYYLKLSRRVEIARDARADLFISIHADAFTSPKVFGASVYTLSEKGASSETARWLADKENRADLIGGVGDVRLDDKDDLVSQVLIDLSMEAKRSTSIEVGSAILEALGGVAKLHKSRVEQAGFIVLKAPDVPSVLIETGYISNPREAKRLNQRDHQEAVAGAIVAGIRKHMERSPPIGTRLAMRAAKEGVRYVIERGDTLSAIALRYGVSQRAIRVRNALNGDRIRVGQVLIIPAG